jgi:hypothetical protein
MGSRILSRLFEYVRISDACHKRPFGGNVACLMNASKALSTELMPSYQLLADIMRFLEVSEVGENFDLIPHVHRYRNHLDRLARLVLMDGSKRPTNFARDKES